MQAKYVIVSELKSDTTKNGKLYTWFYDQDKFRWNLFNNEKVELNKSYILRFEQEGDFLNVKQLEQLTNIFQQKALKEISNKNDVIRNLSVFFSYAKDLVVADKIKLEEIFSFTEKIYTEVNSQAEKYMPKEQN